ncbi:MAG: hypothetical protein PVF65_07415 [Sphingomonadales bacterium]|jgi:hypothetical protein
MPTPNTWTKKRRALFLHHLSETGNVSESARQADMPRHSAYRLRRTDEGFAQDWDDALAQALDQLESVLIQRAIEGVEKPQYFGGKEVGTVKSYSDNLAMFLLKSKRAEVYGDKKAVNTEDRNKTEDPLAALEAKLAAMEHLARQGETDD